MREFQIPFVKELQRGLQDFSTGTLEDPQLFVCYNLMPVEQGLRGHETIIGLGFTTVSFDYLRIKDQLGVTWYWYPVVQGIIVFGSTAPNDFNPQIEAVDVTPPTAVVPSWVEIVDELGATWYLYPDSTTGATRLTDTKPTIGIGLKALVWRGSSFERWKYAVSSTLKTYYGIKV